MMRRRTQQERREGTIRKLLAAATAALVDVGYAEASVQLICARAGVSQGALFRHFATREALMGAVGADVAQQQLARYRRAFTKLKGPREPLVPAMLLVRAHCRAKLNQAWYELAVAARTRPALRRALEPVAARYHADIEMLARELMPELAQRLGDQFALVLETMLAIFDGESLHRFLVKPRFDDERVALLAALVELAPTRART